MLRRRERREEARRGRKRRNSERKTQLPLRIRKQQSSFLLSPGTECPLFQLIFHTLYIIYVYDPLESVPQTFFLYFGIRSLGVEKPFILHITVDLKACDSQSAHCSDEAIDFSLNKYREKI